MRVRVVGFCGVDESFSYSQVQYEWPEFIEWGVLFRPEKQGTTRFPSFAWIEQFVADLKPRHLAAHLCSSRCSQVLLQGDTTFVNKLRSELGFARFQLNATKANGFDSDQLDAQCAQRLVDVARQLSDCEFIVQRNPETKPIWEHLETSVGCDKPPNISFLFDSSVGTGVLIQEFPRPLLATIPFGYAGGLSPTTVREVATAIHESGVVKEDESIWIDMESGLRSNVHAEDSFSPQKAMEVCQVLLQLQQDGVVEFV